MGKVGFGSYRISIKSGEHREALLLALRSGCSLIDTSSNYTNGESEELIGSVLAENPQFKPAIITKAGYVQGKNLRVLQELNEKGLALEDVVEIDEALKHSIHPDFLKSQLEQSLSRLKKDSVDYFLLHNPEYYFKTAGATQEGYYERLKKAFLYCEEEVKKGRIKAYGISSNNLILPLDHPEVTDLKKVLSSLISISATHFKMVQFPFNLIEIGALEKLGEYGDSSLLELCQEHDLISVVNRPLNAFTQNTLVRLATYENAEASLDEAKAQSLFDECLSLVKAKWVEAADETTSAEDFEHVELIKQMKAIWKTLPTPDAVEQVYFGHFFPFIARLWGGGLTPEESKPFYELFSISEIYSRKNLSKKALEFKNQAQQVGLLPVEEGKLFSVMAIETYLDYGFDYVLVGMRKPQYVNDLKHLF